MNRGGQVDTIYTDFAKAFDSVNYSILIEKLKRLNISNCMLSLLKSFLANRKQIVCMNGIKSRTITPTSSVPQGSCLSARLFALFINGKMRILNKN